MKYEIRKIFRYLWCVLLLTLPLFANPLAWKMLFCGYVEFLDSLNPVTFSVLGCTALACILCNPERLIAAWQRQRLLRALMIAGALCLGCAGIQQLLYGGPLEYFLCGSAFILLPFAGIALAPELKRLLPFWCAGLFILLLRGTLKTPLCIGFAGNWNWNFSLLAVTFSALILLLLFKVKYGFLISWLCVGCGVIGVFAAFPEIAPRGTLAGVIGAAALMLILPLFSRQERWKYGILGLLAAFALFISSLSSADSAKLSSSRVQLWRGSLDFALTHAVIGVGPARFESRIPAYLPPEYHFSDFPATRHPHPHNEFLNYWSGFGIAGVLFLVLLTVGALRNWHRRDRFGLWLGGAFLLLLIHGQFDVLIATPLAGILFFLSAGALCGSGIAAPPVPRSKAWRIAAWVLLAAAAWEIAMRSSSGMALIEGRLLQREKKPLEALDAMNRSIEYCRTPEACYRAGNIAFYDLHRPELAIEYWMQIPEKLHLNSFIHLNRQLGHALDVMGLSEESLVYFRREAIEYPFSALNTGLMLGAMQKIPSLKGHLEPLEKRFVQLMKMRKMRVDEFSELLRHPDLDDRLPGQGK